MKQKQISNASDQLTFAQIVLARSLCFLTEVHKQTKAIVALCQEKLVIY